MIAISLSGSMASKNTQNYKILATGETTIFCFTCSDSIPQQFKSNNHSIHVVAPAGCHLSMTKMGLAPGDTLPLLVETAARQQ